MNNISHFFLYYGDRYSYASNGTGCCFISVLLHNARRGGADWRQEAKNGFSGAVKTAANSPVDICDHDKVGARALEK